YVRFATASPAHYRVMFGPFVDGHDGGHPELEAEGERAFRVLVDALLILQRDGIVRPDDAVLAARYIWATVHGVAMLAIDGRLGNQPSITQLTEFAVERIRDAIDRGRPVRRHPH